jgi:hypothetical protein
MDDEPIAISPQGKPNSVVQKYLQKEYQIEALYNKLTKATGQWKQLFDVVVVSKKITDPALVWLELGAGSWSTDEEVTLNLCV